MKKFLPGFLFAILLWPGTALPLFAQPAEADPTLRPRIESAMMKATQFMVDHVSNQGGYLWNYSPDMSRMWGELEAKPTMIWMESPGTPLMGHLLLDAYHATGEEYYLEAARQTASALIRAQLPCGGWNYVADLAGEASLKDWYENIVPRYRWPAMEHLHYYGNATYDDDVFVRSAEFLLRMYLENFDPIYKPALDKAIDFVLESQYPVGGWPQRYPLRYDFVKDGLADYSSFITLNDGVHTGNIRFLIQCYQYLGEERVLEPIIRGMHCLLVLQGGTPQAGWGLQHFLDQDYSPAHARPFEPEGYSSHGTADAIQDLMYYYTLTGNTKFLDRIPDAFAFLESIAIPESEYHWFEERRRPREEGVILCPTFIEKGTNEGLYLHRKGRSLKEGGYYVDYDKSDLIDHYSSVRSIPIARLKAQYEALRNMPAEEATRNSPLLGKNPAPYPKYYSRWMNGRPERDNVLSILDRIEEKPYWPGTPPSMSKQWVGLGPREQPEEVISCWSYIRNMTTLIRFLDPPVRERNRRDR